jgi:hypothetical protein
MPPRANKSREEQIDDVALGSYGGYPITELMAMNERFAVAMWRAGYGCLWRGAGQAWEGQAGNVIGDKK